MPRFSVVVPVYNAEKYLEKCITSVLTQSFDDIELILVDDGSPDGSGRICDSFAATDNRVKVIHQQNQGHITARMNGVKASTGEYILFLDSDDYWLDNLALTVDENLNRYGCDMLIYRFRRGGIPCHDFFESEGVISKNDFFRTLISESGLNALYSKAVKSTLFEGVDISDFSSFKNSEDLVLTVKIAAKAQKIAFTRQKLYYYRETPGSITNSYNPNSVEEYVKSRAVLWEELEKLSLTNAQNTVGFNNAFLWRVAETALQISKQTDFTLEQRKVEYRKITDSTVFIQAVKLYDSDALSFAKRLRISLLKLHLFSLLYLSDRVRIALNLFFDKKC